MKRNLITGWAHLNHNSQSTACPVARDTASGHVARSIAKKIDTASDGANERLIYPPVSPAAAPSHAGSHRAPLYPPGGRDCAPADILILPLTSNLLRTRWPGRLVAAPWMRGGDSGPSPRLFPHRRVIDGFRHW